jgi:hypothetical protein
MRITLNLRKWLNKIPWLSIVIIAMAISALELFYKDLTQMIYAISTCTLVGVASYYYFFLYNKIFTEKKVLESNCVKFWFFTIKRDNFFCHQIKVVFFEELFFRYIPIYVLALFDMNNMVSIGILTIIFVMIHVNFHQQNDFFSLVELFVFFFGVALVYNHFFFFPILFVPHFIRNLCINEASKCLEKEKNE